MKIRAAAALAITSLFMSAAAQAGLPPDGLLFAGYAKANLVGGSVRCMIDAGTSTFVQNISGGAATFVSLSEITYTGTGSLGPVAYRLAGQTHLEFSGSTGGKIFFDANKNDTPLAIYRPNFSGYSENYNSATSTLTVHMTIHFPQCNLPITATYRN